MCVHIGLYRLSVHAIYLQTKTYKQDQTRSNKIVLDTKHDKYCCACSLLLQVTFASRLIQGFREQFHVSSGCQSVSVIPFNAGWFSTGFPLQGLS